MMIAADAHRISVPANPMLPATFRVQRVQRESADVVTLHLRPSAGAALAGFAPGQFNMLYAFGVGEVPISIAGRASDTVTHTIRAVGPVSRALVESKRGASIGVRGPFGSAWPLEESRGRDVLVIAGGIGLAPLWNAFGRLEAGSSPRRVTLLYGARTPGEILYRRVLDRLQTRGDSSVLVTVDRAGPEWRGRVGLVTSLLASASFEPENTLAMICGPELMMRYTARDLMRRGVPESRIYLSMERNMKCAVGFCGHCQFGPEFICRDGPVFRHDGIAKWLGIPEV
jgi:NAD(P)H-flavin reductase